MAMQEGRMKGIVSKEKITQEFVMGLATQKNQTSSPYRLKGRKSNVRTN